MRRKVWKNCQTFLRGVDFTAVSGVYEFGGFSKLLYSLRNGYIYTNIFLSQKDLPMESENNNLSGDGTGTALPGFGEQAQSAPANKHTAVCSHLIMVLGQVFDYIDETLKEFPELHMVKNKVKNDISRSTQSLKMVGGIFTASPAQAEISNTIANLGPMTSIFGQPLNAPAPIAPDDLELDDSEAGRFLRRRDELYERFLDMTDQEIFDTMREPKGEQVIRSVGKKAGLYAFRPEDTEVDVLFLESIRQKMLEANDLNATIARVDGVATRPNLNKTQQEEEDEVARLIAAGGNDAPDNTGMGTTPAKPPIGAGTVTEPAKTTTTDPKATDAKTTTTANPKKKA